MYEWIATTWQFNAWMNYLYFQGGIYNIISSEVSDCKDQTEW